MVSKSNYSVVKEETKSPPSLPDDTCTSCNLFRVVALFFMDKNADRDNLVIDNMYSGDIPL